MALEPYGDFWSFRRRRLRDPFFGSGFGSDLMTTDDFFRSPSHDWISRRYRDDRMVEIERKFDEMVRKVDARFSGIFSLLDDEELFEKSKVDVEHEGKTAIKSGFHLEISNSKNFDLKIDVQDFRPEEVKVKVQGGQVLVHAKRENKNEGDGMYAYSYREFRKAFTVPKEIDVEKLTSSLSSTGVLQIEAPAKSAAALAIESSKGTPVQVVVDKS